MSELEQIAKSICSTNGYTFIEWRGEGAFKETFHVFEKEERSVALKVYREGCSSERSEREIDAMRRCNHPHVARLYFVSTHKFNEHQYLFLLEEYLPGGTLSERVSSKEMSAEEVKAFGAPLVNAVAHIASHELVHRDIKPDNILFRKDGMSPVIVDFGMVRDLSRNSLTPSWALPGPGTPFFASPEQLNNEKDLIDWKADQFSLGLVLSICFLGKHPYSQPGDAAEETVNRVAQRQMPTKDAQDRLISHDLGVLLKMISPWPVDRYRLPSELLSSWPKLRQG